MSEEVNKALKKLVDKRMKPALWTGRVSEVDENQYTCDVVPSDGGAKVYDVRLKSMVTDDDHGMIVIPKANSEVVCAMIGNNPNSCVVLHVETIKTVLIKLDGNAQLEMMPGGKININGDQYGGLVRWLELKVELLKVYQLLMAFKNGFTTWTPVSQDGGAALKAVMSGLLAPLQLPDFNGNTLISDKTKHGSL